VPARLVARVRAALPDSASARLAVRKPAAAFVAEHVARFPLSPAWLNPIIQKAYSQRGGFYELDHPDVVMAIIPSRSSCPETVNPLRQLLEGANTDSVLAKISDAARACECRGVDVEAIGSLRFLHAFPSATWNVYLDVPASIASEGGFGLGLDDTATVADLATALAKAQQP
jgi:hypothetical protein